MTSYYKGQGRLVVNTLEGQQAALRLLASYDPFEMDYYPEGFVYTDLNYSNLDHIQQVLQVAKGTPLVYMGKFEFDWERLSRDMREQGHQVIFLALTADVDTCYPDVHTAYGALL